MEVTVRRARQADRDIIARFNAAMAEETEGIRLDPARVAAGVEAVLADPAKGFYLVAETQGRVVGQLLVTFEWSDWRNGYFWWIQSVYVDPEYRSRGVFRKLYSEVMRRARSDDRVCGLRLYVEKENQRAQSAYERLGMRSAPYRIYEVDFVLSRENG